MPGFRPRPSRSVVFLAMLLAALIGVSTAAAAVTAEGATVATAGASASSPRRPMTVDDQFRLAEPGGPLLSPDGRWVLFPVDRVALAEDQRHTTWWLAPADGSAPPRAWLREGDRSPAWAPRSR